MKKTEQSVFEQWAKVNGLVNERDGTAKLDDGMYANLDLEIAWSSWKACLQCHLSKEDFKLQLSGASLAMQSSDGFLCEHNTNLN